MNTWERRKGEGDQGEGDVLAMMMAETQGKGMCLAETDGKGTCLTETHGKGTMVLVLAETQGKCGVSSTWSAWRARALAEDRVCSRPTSSLTVDSSSAILAPSFGAAGDLTRGPRRCAGCATGAGKSSI